MSTAVLTALMTAGFRPVLVTFGADFLGMSMLNPGTNLSGRYEIISIVGSGGMGEVYRARDDRLGRDVAVKVLPQHMSDNPDALVRFEREASALAALSHPNILTIHDFGSENGISYAVMELLKGETLRTRLAREKPAWTRALAIGTAIAEGLAAAHSQGIIHRDLKPENIYLTADGGLKILDFGLARWEKNVAAGEVTCAPTESRLTRSGVVMGTVPYMSPEQLQGEPVDQRSDIFSLGSVLYEMLSGTLAFPGKSSAETIAAILKEDPVALVPSGGCPPAFIEAISVCIKKKQEDRFQTAHDLAFALKMISGHPSSSPAVDSVPIGVHRFRTTIVIAVVLVALISGIWFYRTPGPGTAIQSLAVLPFVNGSQDSDMEYLSDGITESLINSLSELPQLHVMARGTVFSYKDKQVDPRNVGTDLRVEAVVTGRVTQQGDMLVVSADLVKVADGTQLWGEQFRSEFADIMELQEEISRKILESLRLKLKGEEEVRLLKRHTDNPEAYRLYLKGLYHWNKFTLGGYEKSREYFEEAIDLDPSYALSYSGLSDYYQAMAGDGYMSPGEAYPKAKSLARKALEMDDTLAQAHLSMAGVHFSSDWDWPAYETEIQRALLLKASYVEARTFYSQYLRAMGRFDESIMEAKRAQEIDPLALGTNRTLATAYYWSGQFEKAIEQYRQTIELDPGFPEVHASLAEAYERKRMFVEANAERQRYFILAGDEESASTIRLEFQKHGYSKAMQNLYRKTLQEMMEQSGDGYYVSPMNFAYLYSNLGEKDPALDWLEKAYQERSPWLVFLKTDPQFDSLRSEPRFTDLMRRIGLPL